MSEHRKKDIKGRKHFIEDFNGLFQYYCTPDDMDKIDMYLTALTNSARTYCVEVKNYEDDEHPRPYSKFIISGTDKGYQIDLDKIEYMADVAEKENRTPILYARFKDYTIVWDVSKVDYEHRARWVLTNKDGCNYGKKEYSWQTYFYKDEAVWIKKTQ